MYYFLLAENMRLDEYNILTRLFSDLKKNKITLNKIIDVYIPRIDEKHIKWTINKATLFEFFSFLDYCLHNNISLEDIKPIKDFNVILTDWKVKLLNDYNRILTKKDYIIALRNNFNNQLFETFSLFTNIIIPDRKRKYDFNKLSFISLLIKKYSFKKLKYIFWDISIIFLTNPIYIKYVRNILKDRYNKIVLKSSQSEMWKWVFTFNTKDIYYDKKIDKILNSYIYKPIFTVPFFEIKNEYRIYYTYIDKKLTIYTAKLKQNKNMEDAFNKWKLEMYKELDVSFTYFDKDKFTEEELKFIKTITKWVWRKVWVLEFIKTKDNELYLMEINHLWWLLTCNKKDIDFLWNFYNNLYSNLLT